MHVMFFLLIAGAAAGQTSAYTTTINNNKPPGSGSFQLNVLADNTKPAFNIRIQNPEGKVLQLSIGHRVLGSLIDTVIRNKQFSERYNMEGVEDGRYIVTVKCGKEKITRELELNTVISRSMLVH